MKPRKTAATPPAPTPRCETCGRSGTADCARVDCSNRRPVTANIPDGSSALGVAGGSFYRTRLHDD